MAGANTFPHVLEAADLADLASIHVSQYDFGAICWVESANAQFTLTETPSTPPDGVNVVSPVPQAAVGKPGAAWQKGAGGSGSALVVEQNAVPLPSQPKLNFVGSGFALSNNPGNSSTDVVAVPQPIQEGSTLAGLATLAGADANSDVFVFDTHATYRWLPAGALTPDGWTVVTGPGGQWILQGDRIALAPLGGGADDWPRLIAATNALAYKGSVEMMSGTWSCQTKVQLLSGAYLVANPGTIVNVALGVTLDVFNAPISAQFGAITGVTTLASQNNIGQDTVSVVDLAGGAIVVGAIIGIGNGLRDLVYTVESIAGIGPFTLTLDRLTRMTWAAGTTVAVFPNVPTDIRVEGNGATMTGVCDRFVEIAPGRRCTVQDWIFVSPATAHADLIASFDIAGHANAFRRIRADGGGGRTLGVGLESNESSIIDEVYITGVNGDALTLLDSVDCQILTPNVVSSGNGIVFSADGNVEGCLACTVIGGSVNGQAANGVLIGNGSSYCTVTDMSADDCGNDGFVIDGSAGQPKQNSFEGCSAVRPGLNAFAVAGAGVLGYRLVNCSGGLTSGFNVAFNLQASGEMIGCEIPTGIISVGDGGVGIGGTGVDVKISDCRLKPFYGPTLLVNVGAICTNNASTLSCVDTVSFPVIDVFGTAYLRDLKTAGGTTGIRVQATGVVRRENVDASASTTDSSVAPGGVVSGFAAVKFSWTASASLLTAVPQNVYPGTSATTSSSDTLGYIVSAPDAIGVFTVKHTGDAANAAGQQVTYSLLINGVAQANVTLAANATGTGTSVITAMVIGSGDTLVVTATPSAPLTAAVTDITASAA